jgi:hypothetical protein
MFDTRVSSDLSRIGAVNHSSGFSLPGIGISMQWIGMLLGMAAR